MDQENNSVCSTSTWLQFQYHLNRKPLRQLSSCSHGSSSSAFLLRGRELEMVWSCRNSPQHLIQKLIFSKPGKTKWQNSLGLCVEARANIQVFLNSCAVPMSLMAFLGGALLTSLFNAVMPSTILSTNNAPVPLLLTVKY